MGASMPAEIENIAPGIFRQRLLIEGFFAREIDEQAVRAYLLGIADHLGLRTYGDPVVFSPGAGTGRAENAGFDAFVPLIDSGISGYFWSAQKFLSVLLYTCKGFDQEAALAYTRTYFEIDGATVTHAF
jgi:S-adenosylmethionine decarboxylase